MKTIFRTPAFVLGLVIFVSSCKKSDSGPGSNFTYESKTYSANYAEYEISGGSYSNLVFLSIDPSKLGSYTGKVSAVDVLFDNEAITEGTYTYKADNDPDFDGAKNFFDANAVIDQTVEDANNTPTLDTITAGTITITKNGSTYNVTYSFTFEGGKTITGKYSGAIQVVQS